jgi:hypothetical protein
MMKLYTIERGVMHPVPHDWELRQVVKDIAFTVLGILIGLGWPGMQG